MPLRVLPQIRVAGCVAQVRYSNRLAAVAQELSILTAATHPLRPKLLEELTTPPRDVLRWTITTAPSVKSLPRSTLRTTLKRRWQHAFREALSRRGYTIDGRTLQSQGVHRGLAGRTEVSITNGQGFKDSNEELVRQCNRIVAALEARQHHGK
jgi:hypothetical protein